MYSRATWSGCSQAAGKPRRQEPSVGVRARSRHVFPNTHDFLVARLVRLEICGSELVLGAATFTDDVSAGRVRMDAPRSDRFRAPIAEELVHGKPAWGPCAAPSRVD